MINIKKYFFDELDSTNSYAKSIAGKENGDAVIIAEKQTAGRGRMGRTFHSPEGGIYMSVLLHPDVNKNPTDITVMAAVAVARAIESVLGIYAKIKWVNDIYVNGKKVCGILTEGKYNTEKKLFDYAVLGVGINLVEPESGFPEDIRDIAGALIKNADKELKNALIDAFLNEFYDIYTGKKDYSAEYKSRSNVLGKEIEYIKNGQKYRAEATNITESGELILKSGGETLIIRAGEIKICADSVR